jgi:putative DNA primase/helicase
MIDLARSETGVPVQPQELDAAPFLLNCHNGTIDLQTGAMRPHRRQDLLTMMIPIEFNPAALCPVWEAFLLRILPDADVRTFLQRLVGYSLTADVREQILIFLFGSGSNGKSTFISTLEALVGDYACRTRADVLMQDRHGPNRGATPDLVKLQGRRLVTVTELQDSQRLDEALIKDLTGGDTISARDVYKSGVVFRPTHKLWLAGNHKPVITGTDTGIWRRPRLIPFTETISETERDASLSAKLLQELPGVLAWAVRGCLDWLQCGLQTPVAVMAATQEYRIEQDHLAMFIDECCVLSNNARIGRADLWDAYDAWHKRTGESGYQSATKLSREIKNRPGISDLKTDGKRFWLGIGLRSEVTDCQGR